jgi:hypothetical protein
VGAAGFTKLRLVQLLTATIDSVLLWACPVTLGRGGQGSLVAGKYSTGLVSIAIITCAGAITQALVLMIFFCKQEYMAGWTDYMLLAGLAIAWGVGDATFNTQISALLGILYPHDTVRTWSSAVCLLVLTLQHYLTY